jgi:hypothetical protein
MAAFFPDFQALTGLTRNCVEFILRQTIDAGRTGRNVPLNARVMGRGVLRNVRHARTERALPVDRAPLGPGWEALVRDLDRELWRLQPAATARATIGMDGLLRITVYDPARRADVEALCAEVASRAACTCELCGEHGTLRCGVVLTVRCDGCSS